MGRPTQAMRELAERHADLLLKVTDSQRRFLEAYIDVGTVHGAARRANMSNGTHYHWMKEKSEAGDVYREAFAFHREIHAQTLEGEMFRRAMAGKDDPKSADLLQFALKGVRPNVYRESAGTIINNNVQIGELESARKRSIELRGAYVTVGDVQPVANIPTVTSSESIAPVPVVLEQGGGTPIDSASASGSTPANGGDVPPRTVSSSSAPPASTPPV